ncbi:MAG: hypothetical protein WBA91_03515 [Paracoccaceae bacterium]
MELAEDLLLALGRAALAANCSPTDFLRAMLAESLRRRAIGPEDEVERISSCLALARDWPDLQGRLRAEGFVMRLKGGPEEGWPPGQEVLWVCAWPEERPLMRADEIGTDLAGLCLRFRADFPGRGLQIDDPGPVRRLSPLAATVLTAATAA